MPISPVFQCYNDQAEWPATERIAPKPFSMPVSYFIRKNPCVSISVRLLLYKRAQSAPVSNWPVERNQTFAQSLGVYRSAYSENFIDMLHLLRLAGEIHKTPIFFFTSLDRKANVIWPAIYSTLFRRRKSFTSITNVDGRFNPFHLRNKQKISSNSVGEK